MPTFRNPNTNYSITTPEGAFVPAEFSGSGGEKRALIPYGGKYVSVGENALREAGINLSSLPTSSVTSGELQQFGVFDPRASLNVEQARRALTQPSQIAGIAIPVDIQLQKYLATRQPEIPNIITSENLKNTVSPTAITNASYVDTGNVSNIPSVLPQPPQLPTATSNFDKEIERLSGLTSRLAGRELETTQKIGTETEPAEKQLIEVNKQLDLLKAREADIQKAVESQPIPSPIISAQVAEQKKNLAIEGLYLSARASALENEYNLAGRKAKQAVDLQFSQVLKDIDVARQNIYLNYDKMTLEQKSRADATLLKLNEQDQFVKDQKKIRENINKQIIEAIKGGAPQVITDQAFRAGSELEALKILTPYLKKEPSGLSDFEQAFLRDNKRLPTVKELQIYKNGTRNVAGGMDGLSDKFVNAVQKGETGNMLLNSLSPVDKATIQSILDYTKNPANLSLRKTKGELQSERERLLSIAHLIDPTYDETQYGTRSAIKKDFNSGKSAQNIRSLNTAVGHLDTLAKAGDVLNNASFPLWNAIANRGLTAIGDKRVVAFNTAATAVESELASVFKGMGATDQEIKTWRENINSSQSPAQIKGGIDTAITLMGSRLQALTNQYEIGIGKPKDFRILSDKSRQILSRLGADVEALDPIQTTQTNQSTVKEGDIKNYNGVNYKVINGVWTPQ